MVIVNFPGHIFMPPDKTGEDEKIRMPPNKNRETRNNVFILLITHPLPFVS